MKRRSIFTAMMIFTGLAGLMAQQLPQHSQYMFNDLLYNPAVTGTRDYYQAISNNRYQWIGIVDAPRTYILSVYGPHRGLNMGFGGYIFNDVTGPTSRTGLSACYGYQFKVQDDLNISLGLSAGLLQYRIDATKISFREEDVAVDNQMFTDYVPDANFGVYVYSSKYYGGISANQLFNNRIKIYDSRSSSNTRLKTHIYLMGGYKFELGSDFIIEPSALIKYVAPAPVQFELNGKVIYKQDIWAGISYRHADAVAILIGYEFMDQIYFGYSYDIVVTPIRKHSSGTHEILIGAKFSKLKQAEEEHEYY